MSKKKLKKNFRTSEVKKTEKYDYNKKTLKIVLQFLENQRLKWKNKDLKKIASLDYHMCSIKNDKYSKSQQNKFLKYLKKRVIK